MNSNRKHSSRSASRESFLHESLGHLIEETEKLSDKQKFVVKAWKIHGALDAPIALNLAQAAMRRLNRARQDFRDMNSAMGLGNSTIYDSFRLSVRSIVTIDGKVDRVELVAEKGN